MKQVMTLVALTGGLLAPATAHAGQQTVKLAVGNMYCASCPHIVQKSLSAVPGVSKVVVSYPEKSAVVTFDDGKTTVESIAAASTNAGYPAKLAQQSK
jgi:mercuric ion binding protein